MKRFANLPERFTRKGVTYVKTKMQEKAVLASGRKYRKVTEIGNPNKVVFYLTEDYTPSEFIAKHKHEYMTPKDFINDVHNTLIDLKKYPNQNKAQILFFNSVMLILKSREKKIKSK